MTPPLLPTRYIIVIETRRYVIPVAESFPDPDHPDFHDRAIEKWCSIETEKEHHYLDEVINTCYLPT